MLQDKMYHMSSAPIKNFYKQFANFMSMYKCNSLQETFLKFLSPLISVCAAELKLCHLTLIYSFTEVGRTNV